jgi:hypothetical protein
MNNTNQSLQQVEQQHQAQVTQQADSYHLNDNLNAQQTDHSLQKRAAEIIQESSSKVIVGIDTIANQGSYQQAAVEVDTSPDNHDLTSRAVQGAEAAVKSMLVDKK